MEPLSTSPPNQGPDRKNLHDKDKHFGPNRCSEYENLYIAEKMPKMSDLKVSVLQCPLHCIQQTYYCDSVHNCEYHYFYYRDSKIFPIAQLYHKAY